MADSQKHHETQQFERLKLLQQRHQEQNMHIIEKYKGMLDQARGQLHEEAQAQKVEMELIQQ